MRNFKCSHITVWVFLCFTGVVLSSSCISSRSVVGIVGAMDEEINQILPEIKQKKVQQHLGLTFTKGKLEGKKVVVAKCGIGKVNTAMVLTMLIDRYNPDAILFTGIAGGVNSDLSPGDVIMGEGVTYHDMGYQYPTGFEDMPTTNPIDGTKNPLTFMSDSELLRSARQATEGLTLQTPDGQKAEILQGLIVSGDLFVADKDKKNWLARRYHADAVEMEGAAIGQICYQLGIPFLVIRSISDSADDAASIDFGQFIDQSAKNSAMLVKAIVREMD